MIQILWNKIFWVLLFFISGLNSSYAQQGDFSSRPKNSISIKYGFFNCYDGIPIFYKNAYTNRIKLLHEIGIKFVRQINSKYNWSLDFDVYYHDRQQLRVDYELGTVVYKNFITIQPSIQRTIFSTNSHHVKGSTGIIFRYGDEFLHGGFYGGTPGVGNSIESQHLLFDFGVPIGFNYYYSLNKRFFLMTSLEHIIFPYVRDSKRNLQYNYEWDNGTSRNMTKLQVGFGINF